ncbi:hypothetical protein SAMN07250955_10668 [Arboricoccus pini]|uniref:Uncharacterized protein n=2 Tax=Arboricoccus pini TaxID=1963835 RepID=A0A212R778_9PROT|nr:hypothetical protein SAMN07250955_10668 [Arboricoccus pini]
MLLRCLERQQREILAIKRRPDMALNRLRQRRDPKAVASTATRSWLSDHRARASASRRLDEAPMNSAIRSHMRARPDFWQPNWIGCWAFRCSRNETPNTKA